MAVGFWCLLMLTGDAIINARQNMGHICV
jgi:hypothetical protein